MALFGEFSKTSPRIGRNNYSVKKYDSRHSYLHNIVCRDSCLVSSPDRGSLSPGPGAYTGNIIETPRKKPGVKQQLFGSSAHRLSSPSFKTTVITGDIIIKNSKHNTQAPGPGSYMDIYDNNSPWNKKSFNVRITGKNTTANQKKSNSPASKLHRADSAPSLHEEEKTNINTVKAVSTSASSYYLQLQEEQKKLQEKQRKYYENYYAPKQPSTMASSSITVSPKLDINLEAEGGNDDTFTTENIYSPKSPAPVNESNRSKSQNRFGKKTLKSRTINRYR